MQFGFMLKCGTTNAIFITRQLQEKFLQKKKRSVIMFVGQALVGYEEA